MSGDQDPRASRAMTTRGIADASRPAFVLSREQREALCARRPEALEAFYDAYFSRIYAYVRRMVHDEHLSEDLTQDIFMDIHCALPSYDPARDLRPWVFTIATNRLRDLWQSRSFQEDRRRTSLDDDDTPPAPAHGVPGPPERLAAGELGEAVAAAIERLPDGIRMTFWLRWHEGLSFAEIANQLASTELAMRKRYSRALAELRIQLAGWFSAAGESTGADL